MAGASRPDGLERARIRPRAITPRHSRERLLIDPSHYEGPSTDRVEAPVPLGRMGRRLQEVAALVTEERPLDLSATLAEVAR